jgi:hypothetical protein
MRRCFPIQSALLLLHGFLLLIAFACSNGSAPAPSPAPVAPPQSLAYATNPASYTLGQVIPANAPSQAGAVTGYTVSPTLPAGLALNATSGILTGTPTALAASATYTVTATNAGGSTTASLTITVNDVAPSSLVYASPTATYTKGVAISPNTSSSGGGAITSYSVSPGLPAGLSLSPSSGVVSGTPAAITASASYTVTATNSGGSTTASLTITVNDVAPGALAYAAGTAIYIKGVAITPNFPSNAGGTVLSYSVSPGLPAGLSLNPSTGVVSGAPTATAAVASYTVTGTNTGGSTTTTLTITVNNPPDVAPAFTTQPGNQTVTVPGVATFSVVVTGSPTPTLQWQRSTNGGSTWADLAGATSSSYVTPATTSADNGRQFRVVATNTAGTLASAPATLAVAALAKAWQAAVQVGPSSGDISSTPQIGFDSQGNALAVWAQYTVDFSQIDLWANRYVAGSGWGTAQIIFAGVGDRVARPLLGVDASGKAVVIWELRDDPHDSLPHIMSSRFDPAAGWGTPVGIDTDSGVAISGVGFVKLAVAANGSAVAIWNQQDTSLGTTNVCMATGATATGLGSVTVVATGPIGTAGAVAGIEVALNAQGAGFAFWNYWDGTIQRIKAAPIAAGSAGGTEIIATGVNYFNPHATVNAAGTAVLVWGDSTGGRLGIWSTRYLPGSGWGMPVQVNAPSWTAFTDFPDPQVVLDDAGLATALWLESSSAGSTGRLEVVWNHQTAAGWGMPEVIFNQMSYYQLAGNGAGQLLGARMTGGAVYGSPNYLVTTADWGPGTRVGAYGKPPLNLAIDPNGNGMAIWIQPPTGSKSLWGSAYR